MWNKIKKAYQKAETRRRSERELDRLFAQGERTFHDIGYGPDEIMQARKALKYL